jgi:hypothetical protein
MYPIWYEITVLKLNIEFSLPYNIFVVAEKKGSTEYKFITNDLRKRQANQFKTALLYIYLYTFFCFHTFHTSICQFDTKILSTYDIVSYRLFIYTNQTK